MLIGSQYKKHNTNSTYGHQKTRNAKNQTTTPDKRQQYNYTTDGEQAIRSNKKLVDSYVFVGKTQFHKRFKAIHQHSRKD